MVRYFKDARKEKAHFVGEGVQEISQNSNREYSDNIFGVSIIECESLKAALSLTNDWPELPYEGKIEVLKAIAE